MNLIIMLTLLILAVELSYFHEPIAVIVANTLSYSKTL